MSPYIIYVWTRTTSFELRGHGLHIASGGTSLDKNTKISITTSSSQKITTDSESYYTYQAYFIGIFPTPDKVVLPRKKTLREFLFDGPHSL